MTGAGTGAADLGCGKLGRIGCVQQGQRLVHYGISMPAPKASAAL